MSGPPPFDWHEKPKLRVEGQVWIVFNIIGPGLRQKSKDSAFRVLGVFATEPEADEFAKEYEKKDRRFDVFKSNKMGMFIPIPDEVPAEMGEVKFSDDRMTKMFKAYKEVRETTQDFQDRIRRAKLNGTTDEFGLTNLNE